MGFFDSKFKSESTIADAEVVDVEDLEVGQTVHNPDLHEVPEEKWDVEGCDQLQAKVIENGR